MEAFIDILVNQFLRVPAYVLSIVVLIGSIALRRSAKETIVSTLKTLCGMLILNVGSTTLQAGAKGLLVAVFDKFNVNGILMDNWVWIGEIEERLPVRELSYVGIIMVLAMLTNLVLARLTPIKTIYLTGHTGFCDTWSMLFLLYITLGLTGVPLIVASIVILVLYWWLGTWLFLPLTKKLVGEDTQITVGHNVLLGCTLGWLIAGLFKKDEKKNPDCEAIHLPGWLGIFSDGTVAYGIIMGLMYIGIALILGKEAVDQVSGGAKFWLLYGLEQGLQIAIGVTILLSGVRMFLGELIPAFKGFATKIVPGAIAAIDTPAFWPYGPNATMVGFVFTTIGMVVSCLLLILFKSPIVPIPSIIPIFFGGAIIGVFCNKKGGVKGTVAGTFFMGLLSPLGLALLAKVATTTLGTQAHTDYAFLWMPFFALLKFIGSALGLV